MEAGLSGCECAGQVGGVAEGSKQQGFAHKAPVRVLHVLEATEGGTRRWLENVVTGLDPGRVRSACVCSVRRDPQFRAVVERFRSEGIPVWVLDMRREISPLADWRALGELVRILRGHSFDIVHGHSAKGGMLARLAGHRIGHSCVVYSPHAFPFLAGGLRGWLYRMAEKHTLRLANALVAVSEAEARAALDLGYPAERIHVALNGVEVVGHSDVATRGNCAPPVVGTVSSLRPQKDPLAFVEVCALVSKLRPDARFKLYGEGPLEPVVRQRRREVSLEGKLEILGKVADASPVATGWNVFLLCSRYEGMCYGLLEAMAAGTPVVAMAVPGVEEVIEHEKSGLLAPSGDIGAAASAVLRLLADPDLARRLGESARRRIVERYSLARQIERLTGIYERLARGPRVLSCAAR